MAIQARTFGNLWIQGIESAVATSRTAQLVAGLKTLPGYQHHAGNVNTFTNQRQLRRNALTWGDDRAAILRRLSNVLGHPEEHLQASFDQILRANSFLPELFEPRSPDEDHQNALDKWYGSKRFHERGARLFLSPYSVPLYQHFVDYNPVSEVEAFWNVDNGEFIYPPGLMSLQGKPERKALLRGMRDVFTSDALFLKLGKALRDDARRLFERALHNGLQLTSYSAQAYIREYYPHYELVEIGTGIESTVYAITSKSNGKIVAVLKRSAEHGFFGHYDPESGVDMTQDQVLAILRYQRALDAAGIKKIRTPKLHAMGPRFLIREYFEPKTFKLKPSDIKELEKLEKQFEDLYQRTGGRIDYRMMLFAIQRSLQIRKKSPDAEAWNIVKDSKGRFVIFDPI